MQARCRRFTRGEFPNPEFKLIVNWEDFSAIQYDCKLGEIERDSLRSAVLEFVNSLPATHHVINIESIQSHNLTQMPKLKFMFGTGIKE